MLRLIILVQIFLMFNISCSNSNKKAHDAPVNSGGTNIENCKKLESYVLSLESHSSDRDSIMKMFLEDRSTWSSLSEQDLQDVWDCFEQRSAGTSHNNE